MPERRGRRHADSSKLTCIVAIDPYANRSFFCPPGCKSVSKPGIKTALSGKGSGRLFREKKHRTKQRVIGTRHKNVLVFQWGGALITRHDMDG